MNKIHALCRIATAAVCAALLLNATTRSAEAADGQFTYTRTDTQATMPLAATPSDQCLPLDGGATHAANDTDATAFLYADDACTQLLALAEVGAIWEGVEGHPAHSVRFGS
ncbi:hypothetical protein [Streptomyces sp. NPDC050738]|uniref:hypothetical protein n=1 Tax=Streptomyces sp. NPDC050738 TaxID=3154744 RepID=UPI00342B112C